jgi:membrane protease YdiL (CAAX protease family)
LDYARHHVSPLAAVLLMLLAVTRDGYTRAGWLTLGMHRLGWQQWGLAVLVPLLVLGCTYGVVWGTGMGRLTLPTTGWPLVIDGLTPVVISVLLSLAAAFGEEIGWRGYLLPHLLPLGRIEALLASGLMHGLWHLPAMLLTPFYHESGDRLIVALLFVVSTTFGGVFYGYLRLTSESVWPPVLAHLAFNTIWTTFTALTVAVASPLLLEYLAGESGILTLIGVALVAGWLLYRWQPQSRAGQVSDLLASEPFA